MRCSTYFLVATLLAAPLVQAGGSHRDAVDRLIAAERSPDGVVFEIVSREATFLDRALPEVKSLAQKLRHRFPGLEIAVVSHGREMFSLTARNQAANPALQTEVQGLIATDIPIHVCGTFAGWNNVETSEFPAHIDVAAAGPAQVNDYVKLGYTRIVIMRLD